MLYTDLSGEIEVFGDSVRKQKGRDCLTRINPVITEDITVLLNSQE